MSVREVLFIRHGQTDFNVERRLQGAMPVPLNDCGIRQSYALAEYMQTISIDAIFTSPRLRAKETAQIIGEVLHHSVQEDERLAEIAFGEFEGYTFAEVAERFPDAYKKWDSGYRRYRVPGGESRHEAQMRMQSAWDEIACADNNVDTVAIVGHSSAMMIFLASMFAFLPSKPMHNTSITTLERYQEIWRIRSFAETPHFAR